MAKSSGRVIKYKTPSRGDLSEAKNTGETWYDVASQNQPVDNKDFLREQLPELFSNEPKPKVNLTFGKKDLYASMDLVEKENQPFASAVSTASDVGQQFGKKVDEVKTYYKDLPLYDDPKDQSEHFFRSKEEFQKYGKEQVLSSIVNQVKQSGGIGSDLSKSALQEMVGNTITASFLNKMGLSIDQLPTNVTYDDKGDILFHGVPLDLSEDTKHIINDFNIERTSYRGENDSLLKQAAMFAGTFALDLPLFMASGGLAGGIVSKIPFLAESAAANSVFGRIAGTIAVNDLMFNTLSIPKFIDIAKGNSTETVLDEIWNNTKFSTAAAVFGSVGLGFSKLAQSVVKSGESKLATLIQRYPSAFQELNMLGSSFTLGAVFPSDVNRDNQITATDRIVTGLTFASMHFANPNAFKTFGKEIQNRNILMEVQDVNLVKTLMQQHNMSLEDAIKYTGLGKDNYYELKDNKLLPIDTDEFANNGKITMKDGAIPLDYDKDMKKNYRYINEIEPTFVRTMRDNLKVSSINGVAENIYDRLSKTLDPQYVKENKNLIKNLSWTIASSKEIGSLAEGFRKNKLPENVDIQNKVVNLSNEYKLPYKDVEKYLVNNLPQYFENPERFAQAFIENSGGYSEGLPLPKKFLDTIEKVADDFAKEVEQKSIQTQFNLAQKQLLPYTGEPVLIDKEAEAVKRQLLAEQKAKGTVLPSSGDVFFDYKGKLLPVEIDNKKKTATIVGTDVTMNLDAIKDRTATKKELKEKQQKQKESKSAEDRYIAEQVASNMAKGINLTEDEISKLRKEYRNGQKQVGISKDTQVGTSGGLRPEASSSGSDINVGENARKQSNESVNEETPIVQEEPLKITLIQTKGEENIKSPTTSKEEISVENLRSPEGNQPIKELAQKVSSIPKGQGYDNPELKSNLDAAWEKVKEITNQIGGKAKPGQVFSHLLSNEGLSDEQIAGLYRTKFPENKVTASNINDWRNKGIGKDVVGEALKGLKTSGYNPEISPAESVQAGLEPIKSTTSTYKPSEVSEVLPGAIQEMIKNKYNPSSEADINKASLLGNIDDMQRRALLKNLKAKDAGESRYLDDLLAQSKISKEQYDQAKELFKSVSPEEEIITDPVKIESIIKDFEDYKKRIGYDIPVQRVESIKTPEGQEATGSYKYDNLGSVIKLSTKQMTELTPNHELLHFGMRETGEAETWDRLLKEAGGDKEKLADQFAQYTRTHKEIDTSTVWGKVKHFFTKLADYFRDALGWNTKADYFRRLANGELAQRKQTSEEIKAEEFNTIKKPLSVDPEEAQNQFAGLMEEYEQRKDVWEHSKPTFSNSVFKENVLARGIRSLVDKGFNQMAIQTGNYAYQKGSNGKYVHERFKRFYDDVQGKVINATSVAYNKIIKNPEGWNQNKQVNNMTTPEQNSYLNKIRAYDDAIYTGDKKPLKWNAENGETFNEFADRVAKEKGFNDTEKEAWKRYQLSAREANDTARQGVIDDAKTWLDKDGNRKLTDEEANALGNKMFPKFFGDYYNTSRPIQSGYYIIKGFKPKINSEGQVIGEDRYSAYGRNKPDAIRKVNEWNAKGYVPRETTPVNDILRDKRYDKLTANQLLNLADAGAIPKNDEVIQALLDAVKSGRYEQHSIDKEYIPGMEYSPKEYQESMERLVNEAVSSSVKRLGLQSLRDELMTWRTQTERIPSDSTISEAIKESAKREYDYAIQYYNQIAHSDKSFMDAPRNLASVYYIGLKPSFWFQQMLQPLQNAFPEALAETKGLALSGAKVWKDAFSKAYELGWVKRAEQKGEHIDTQLPQELLNLYDRLDNMRKLGATGIQELMGETGNADYQYASGVFDKSWKTMVKVANMGGAIAEKYTRLQAMVQFYDIGKAKGLEGSTLEEYVVRKIDDVMAQWGAGGRPAITNPKSLGQAEQKLVKGLSKSFFTFKTYSAANLGQYDRLIRNRQWGALGSKMLVGIGMRGVTKFPLMATFFSLYNLFSDDDLEYEAIRTLDELNDKVGMKFGTILSRGALSTTGINMQNLFDERTAFATDVYSMTRSKSAGGRLAEAMFGAPYGVANDIITGASGVKTLLGDLISSDNMLTEGEKTRAKKNLYQMSPLFIRNVATALSLDSDGVELKGKQLIKSEDISWADVLYKMIGFNPLKITDAYENQFNGTPAKLSRAKGKIAELKRIRKDISTSKNYDVSERSNELRKVVELMREAQKEEALYTKQLALEERNRY